MAGLNPSIHIYIYMYILVGRFWGLRDASLKRVWKGTAPSRCTLVDWALHACGLGAARLWIGSCTLVDWAQKIYIFIPLRTPIGLPIKGRLIKAVSYKLQGPNGS